jgi:hypothetical protein
MDVDAIKQSNLSFIDCLVGKKKIVSLLVQSTNQISRLNILKLKLISINENYHASVHRFIL